MDRKIKWITAVLLLTFAAAYPVSVYADSCWLLVDEDQARSMSDVIFTGTAVAKSTEVFEAIELEGRRFIAAEKTTFVIESVEKGKLRAGDEVRVEKGEECSCAGEFEIGKKYLVHARLNKSSEWLELHFCEFNRQVE